MLDLLKYLVMNKIKVLDPFGLRENTPRIPQWIPVVQCDNTFLIVPIGQLRKERGLSTTVTEM
jgi:hypothetical protein